MSNTFCYYCKKYIPDDEKGKSFVLCVKCGKFYTKNNKPKHLKTSISNKIDKKIKGGKMEEKQKKGWQKKTILELLSAGKGCEEIATETGIRISRVKRVKKKFFDNQ